MRFVYGEDQLLYISNGRHVHPVLNRATVSPFHSDCEYPLASSLITHFPSQEAYTRCGHIPTDRPPLPYCSIHRPY